MLAYDADEIRLQALAAMASIVCFLTACTFFIIRVVHHAMERKAKRKAFQARVHTIASTTAPSPASEKPQVVPVSRPTGSASPRTTSVSRPAAPATPARTPDASKADMLKKLYTKCAACGEEHPDSEMFPIDGKHLCQSCFRVKYAPIFEPPWADDPSE